METKGVDDVVDLHSTILGTLLGFLSRGVGSSVCIFILAVCCEGCGTRGVHTDFDGAKSDHGAVALVDGSIDLLQIVGVGDDLVTGDNVL